MDNKVLFASQALVTSMQFFIDPRRTIEEPRARIRLQFTSAIIMTLLTFGENCDLF